MITVGEVIKKKRESLGKNLNVVLADTKIQRRFLEYIENNEFDKFDSSRSLQKRLLTKRESNN